MCIRDRCRGVALISRRTEAAPVHMARTGFRIQVLHFSFMPVTDNRRWVLRKQVSRLLSTIMNRKPSIPREGTRKRMSTMQMCIRDRRGTQPLDGVRVQAGGAAGCGAGGDKEMCIRDR